MAKHRQLINIIRVVKLIRLAFILLLIYSILSYFGKKNTNENINNSADQKSIIKKNIKLFCIIEADNDKLDLVASVVYESWAHKCSDHIFYIKSSAFQNSEDNEPTFNKYVYTYNISNIDNYKHLSFSPKFHFINILEHPPITDDNLLEKILFTFNYIYYEHEEKLFDWYLKTNQKSFINMINLKNILVENDENSPHVFGKVSGDYLNPKASYVMSKETFRRMGEKINSDSNFCQQNLNQESDLSTCFNSLQCKIMNSVDQTQKEIFHSASLFTLYPSDFYDERSTCCSDKFISLYDMKPIEMLEMSTILDNPMFDGQFKSLCHKMMLYKNNEANHIF